MQKELRSSAHLCSALKLDQAFPLHCIEMHPLLVTPLAVASTVCSTVVDTAFHSDLDDCLNAGG